MKRERAHRDEKGHRNDPAAGARKAEGGTADRHPRRWLILVVLCLSTLVLVVDNMGPYRVADGPRLPLP
ncbi:hypothetical protein ABZ714_29350 [Streptomyces sp. NPDC006798]|uniref:hypothetical protein n=1 Tax=Streptomyces sp. NPDC006798 TaxID=3155462 RepID=UPI0034009AAA